MTGAERVRNYRLRAKTAAIDAAAPMLGAMTEATWRRALVDMSPSTIRHLGELAERYRDRGNGRDQVRVTRRRVTGRAPQHAGA